MALKNLLQITRGDGTTLDIDKVAKAVKPELTAPMISEQFFNPTFITVSEGVATILHNIKSNLKTGTTHNEGLTATDDKSTRYKEEIEFDGYYYGKKIFSKDDALVWEGKGAVPQVVASWVMDSRELRIANMWTALKNGIKTVNTLTATSGASAKMKFNGTDGNKFDSPVIAQTAKMPTTDAEAFDEVAKIFKAIDEIRAMGEKGSAHELFPFARGYSGKLGVIIRNDFALVIARAKLYQETGTAENRLTLGMSGEINSTAFIVDSRLPKELLWAVVPMGTEAPIYVPDRSKFKSMLINHPEMPSDYWRLTASLSSGAVYSERGMCLSRFGLLTTIA